MVGRWRTRSQFRHALNTTMEGKCCGLKPNPMRRLVSTGIRFSGSTRPPYAQAALSPGRRGAESKSSFDVCLNDFEWEKPNEGETRRKNKGLRRVKSARVMISVRNTCSVFNMVPGSWNTNLLFVRHNRNEKKKL